MRKLIVTHKIFTNLADAEDFATLVIEDLITLVPGGGNTWRVFYKTIWRSKSNGDKT